MNILAIKLVDLAIKTSTPSAKTFFRNPEQKFRFCYRPTVLNIKKLLHTTNYNLIEI